MGMGFLSAAVFLLAPALPAPASASGCRDDDAARLIAEALGNGYRGAYSAEVVFVRESFLRGTDSLRGRLDFNDHAGERQFRVRGQGEAFEWWSRNFGQEQWWRDENNSRVRRIPFRSLRKPAFASLLTFEDLTKLPADYLLDFQSCRGLQESDSLVAVRLQLRPSPLSRYAALEAAFTRDPVLLRRVDFFGYDGRKLKSLEVPEYRSAPGGKFMPASLNVFDGDSLSSLRVSLRHPQAAPAAPGGDHAAVATDDMSRIIGRYLAGPRLEEAEVAESAAP
jgi:hypothetical protein